LANESYFSKFFKSLFVKNIFLILAIEKATIMHETFITNFTKVGKKLISRKKIINGVVIWPSQIMH